MSVIIGGNLYNVAGVMTAAAADRPLATLVNEGTIFVASDTSQVSIAGDGVWNPLVPGNEQHSVSPQTGAEVGNVVQITATLLDANAGPVANTLVELCTDDATAAVTYAAVAGQGTLISVLDGSPATGARILGRTNGAGVFRVDAAYVVGPLTQTWYASSPGAADSGQASAVATWT